MTKLFGKYPHALLVAATLFGVAGAALGCRGDGRPETAATVEAETAALTPAETVAETAAVTPAETVVETEVEVRPACPACGSSEDVVPIVYGKPSRELVEAAERGEVIIEGCVHPVDAPAWHCRRCGREWK